MPNEGPEPFSPYDVVGHLIHGEATDWTAPGKMIRNSARQEPSNAGTEQPCTKSNGKTMQLLDTFSAARKKHGLVPGLNLAEADLDKKGMHRFWEK